MPDANGYTEGNTEKYYIILSRLLSSDFAAGRSGRGWAQTQKHDLAFAFREVLFLPDPANLYARSDTLPDGSFDAMQWCSADGGDGAHGSARLADDD